MILVWAGAASGSRLKVVVHETNQGYGAALISAFGAATKEWIFYTDGDGQYDAKEAALMISAVADDTDIVQATRSDGVTTWLGGSLGAPTTMG